MRKFLSILTGLAIALTLPVILLCLWGFIAGGFKNEAAMVLIMFMYTAGLTATIAFLLGAIGLFIDSRANVPLSRISISGVIIGVLAAALIGTIVTVV